MAIKFQYNKTSLQDMNKQLKVRVNALPTLQNKEAALRVEVKKAKYQAEALTKQLEEKFQAYENMVALWGEFDTSLIRVKDIKLTTKKIAGVKTPVLEEVLFEMKGFSVFNKPKWFLDGLNVVKELTRVAIERDFFLRKTNLLDYARKKTTQKVNLYEKVQIPGYEDAIRKIKRFLEDEENLSKAAQKIVKQRLEAAEQQQ